ncbi:MAG: S8 family serine peptidase [Bacteroidota bacterium]
MRRFYFLSIKSCFGIRRGKNVLVVASAGNFSNDNDTDEIMLPASFNLPNIISVGSIDCDDQLSSFSNFGARSVDILAQGESIPGPDLASGLSLVSGTSQSTAIVTAIAALTASHLDDKSYYDVKCAILSSTDYLPNLNEPILTNGKINAAQSLSNLDDEFKPVVSNSNDNGLGSLRWAIHNVCFGETINVSPDLTGETIRLSCQEVVIDKSLTIAGLGVNQFEISGENNSRVFHILDQGSLYLKNLSITNGNNQGSIFNEGYLQIKDVSLE